MPTVACVLKSGGGVYDQSWVRKLQRGVSDHLPMDHRFVCLTDVPIEDVETIPLEHDWPGWWSKIELFRPGLFDTPVLYIDLDCLVIGDISGLFSEDAFTMWRDALWKDNGNSSVMSWASEHEEIYNAFRLAPKRLMEIHRPGGSPKGFGDQRLIHTITRPAFYADGMVQSFKFHCRERRPENASIVAFHGFPKPSTSGAGWGYHHWMAL